MDTWLLQAVIFLHLPCQKFSNIKNLDTTVTFFQSVFKHSGAIWTGNSHIVRVHIDMGPQAFLHEHAAAAGTAAERFFPAAGHLRWLFALIHLGDQLSGGVKDAVPSTEITGIMEGNGTGHSSLRGQFPLIIQIQQKLGMVHHRIICTKPGYSFFSRRARDLAILIPLSSNDRADIFAGPAGGTGP